jgi:hypothetical protein
MRWSLTLLAFLAVAPTQRPPAARPNAETPRPIEGLWEYETITRSGAQPVAIAGLFVFRDGQFVQQSLNAGEPYERQLAQAHAGTYQLGAGTLRMLVDVGLVVDPSGAKPIDWRGGTVHEVTVSQAGDRLTLKFGTGTIQTFKRVGAGRGELIQLDRGAFAIVDGRFILAAEGQDRAISGSGSFERQGEVLRLRAERWLSVRAGQPVYARDRTVEARLTPSTLTVAGDEWRVRASHPLALELTTVAR